MRLKIPTIPQVILFALLVNLAIAPVVYAAGSGAVSRSTAYAMGLLLVVVLALAIYLAMVIIQPERF
ncbi:potassium-transporting ATPase subunit F [Synechocystis salina LEGE 06099]|uniref:potassium-transporting ATPase subunit F n=1 Tax=Synechocystis salina TaxID=945780 RepID=UPI00188112D5|nr:potassium-transporting ATPase subunit F [Synechocystis salina]MBE9202619.1 potassium-transporting ATPase subunit F [Synechocystis salina LEGE 06099]